MTSGARQVIAGRMRRKGIECNDFRVGVSGSWAILRWQPMPSGPFAPAWFEARGQRPEFGSALIADKPLPVPIPRSKGNRTWSYAAEWYSLLEFRVNGLI